LLIVLNRSGGDGNGRLVAATHNPNIKQIAALAQAKKLKSPPTRYNEKNIKRTKPMMMRNIPTRYANIFWYGRSRK
jgi:hypothetical protein